MSDNLRDRIAAVLDKHYPQTTGYQDELTDWCQCGMPRGHVADAVIEVLDTDYVLVPKSHTIVRWRQADQPPEGVFRHEVISEWAADE